jgi:hypothetical protein
MLRCGMVGAGDVGGLWWLELTMETACIHVSPMSRTHTNGGALSSDPVCYISLFKNILE